MTERFIETISTGIITDNLTGKEYNCEYRVSDEFLELINQLAHENEQLKDHIKKLEAQLLYTETVCNICNNHSLVQKEEYYISKCKKEHEECSKIDLNYCEDFELVEDYK